MARLLSLGLLLLTAAALRADSLASAQLARVLLGPDVWSRVLRIENRRADPRHPLEFQALVFAVEDRLWLYDALEGTQSLSLFAGRLERDKADLAPLLRHVLPNFVRFIDLTDAVPTPARAASASALPFGCFINCYLRWRALLAGPSPPDAAAVLAFYYDTSMGPRGHSVLVYQLNGRRLVYDPDDDETAHLVVAGAEPTPLELAREICTLEKPFRAQLLALHSSAEPREEVAANDRRHSNPQSGSEPAGSATHASRAALF